ncbi:MAG: ribulose-phosphate 3-epimerase [Ruminococcaceae bacterium]|nr:ribulose-phosphate 3-epimerase [Oscillospiraceae bacterium]
MEIKVSPSILSADFSMLGDEIKKMEAAGADLIHIDVMDGHFVPNISLGMPVIKKARKVTKLPFDVHLMIENPEKYIDAFVAAGSDIITVHQEACVHLHRVVQMIKKAGVKAGVALNPMTNVETLKYILPDIDMVLIMSVNPGFGAQSYIPVITRKIAEMRALCIREGYPDMDIEVDGGVDAKTYVDVVGAGANVLVAGNALFTAEDPKALITLMKSKQ